jgi:hypothetical protein
MAFLPPEQQNQYAPQGQTTPSPAGGAPPQTGGSSGTGAGASKAGGEPSSQGTPTQFGSSASKLSDYLSANAPQIQNQANTVAGNLNNQYAQVGTDINAAANQFGQQVQGGYAATNQNIVNQALANPTGFVSNPGNVSAFQGQYNDTYTGPQNFESTTPYSNIQNEVGQAVQNAGLLGNQAGLQTYLSQNAGPNATQASNTLDALLLQGNPQAQQTIKTAANQFQNLTPQLTNAVTGADQSVQAAQQAAQNAQQYAQQQAANTTNQFNTQLQNQVTAGQAAENAYNNLVNQNNQYLGNARPLLSDINAYAQQYNQSLPTDLTQYLAPNGTVYNTAANINNTASSQQVAEANALAQLLGTGYTNPITDATQVGTFNVPTSPTALTSPNMTALELQGLTPLTQQFYNSVYNKPGNTVYNPNESIAEMTLQLAGEGGSNLAGTGTGQGQAYENLLAQLAGFNNGEVSKIPGFNNYYEVANPS